MQNGKTFHKGEKAALSQKWLLLGGTGTISTSLMRLLAAQGMAVTCLNRGHRPLPDGVEQIVCDVNDETAMAAVLEGRGFDVVADFLTYGPEQAETRVRQFRGKCGRYVFISTAMTYEKPPRTMPVSEQGPQGNPFSPYAQNKIICEGIFRKAYREQGFPLTIIRPSCTYGEERVPFVMTPMDKPNTILSRLRAGKPIVVPGDGSVFWTITHSDDFARALLALAQNPGTLGEDFHITQDECMTWDAFAAVIAEEAGAPAPTIVHVTTDDLIREKESLRQDLLGDMAQTAIFDNSKLRRFVPDFRFEVPYREGVARSIRNVDANPALQAIDTEWDAWVDGLIAKYGRA